MSCFSATSSSAWDSLRSAPPRCLRTPCIEWGNNVIGGRERAKHIDIRKHFAHEVIQNGKMRLVQVATALQLADIFTKPLHYPQWKACVEGILRCVIVNS